MELILDGNLEQIAHVKKNSHFEIATAVNLKKCLKHIKLPISPY